jgi:hypothetical protein
MVWAVSLSTTDLSTRSLTPGKHIQGIRGLIGFGTTCVALAHSVPYPPATIPRLYLNTFRGEPAITKFDWPFTPTHSSSELFATNTGSDLHEVLPPLHPDHG